jgi:hypothetical protein
MCAKKTRVGPGQNFIGIEGFTIERKHIGVNFIHAVTVSQQIQFQSIVWKTFASANFHLFALLCHSGLH